jgi:predicted ATPase
MLFQLRANGFRSLKDFTLDLRQGLNVLVGPNGAGKTNVIRLLEFLSDLTEHSVAEAISRGGGAGDVFSRIPFEQIDDVITLGFSGVTRASEFHPSRRTASFYLRYEYDATIKLHENTVYFSAQSLKIQRSRANLPFKKIKPHLQLYFTYDMVP